MKEITVRLIEHAKKLDKAIEEDNLIDTISALTLVNDKTGLIIKGMVKRMKKPKKNDKEFLEEVKL